MGAAAQAGIVAFDLASAGMQCSETILEGRAGLFAAFSASDGERLFRQGLEGTIGQGIEAVRFKPVPGCNYAQTPLAVALRLSEKQKLPSIDRVAVTCTSGAKNYPGCDNPGPFTNVQQTKMSIQFGVCAVLLNGNVSEDLFKKYSDRQINDLVSHCTLEIGSEFEESFSRGLQPARIDVHLTDGTTVSEELPDVPWLDADAVRQRFVQEMKFIIPSEKARKRFMNMIDGMESVKNCSDDWEHFKETVLLQAE